MRDHAIEGVRRDCIRALKTSCDRRSGMAVGDMQNITAQDGGAAISLRVSSIPDFKNSAMNESPVTLQEIFDVITINRQAT